MFRTNNCGELRIDNLSKEVVLSGWVQKIRNKGFMIWIDLRDRYGITQIVFDQERTSKKIFQEIKAISREYVIQIKGSVLERESKNPKLGTGDIEILAKEFIVLNPSLVPPFTIEDKTDGGEELRMKYRYLDIRRTPIRENLILRSKISLEIRNYLSNNGFIDVETPYLIKSTPEGARDFVVPSRMNPGHFYALPQSPQTFKQLLMVGGIDKYFQIVKCFRDEDLRADRQPEFTQIDCEMSFVNQEEIINQFEDLLSHLLLKFKGIQIGEFPRITFNDSMERYGCDKPDIRFGMELNTLNSLAHGKGFNVFDSQESIIGICVPGASSYSRKQIDELTDWVKNSEINGAGLIWVKYDLEGNTKSSVDKYFDSKELIQWVKFCDGEKGDLLLIMSGKKIKIRNQMSLLRLEMAERLGLRKPNEFAPLWIIDFPLLEWDEKMNCYRAIHHPFTAPKSDHLDLLNSNPREVFANAYDLVLNGNEIGGGSIRINSTDLQKKMFDLLGFSKEEAMAQFGFLMESFQYGAPPHGGIALGLDRLVALLGGKETIREFIAFPKNNSGRDLMINSPSKISNQQLDELGLSIDG